MEEIVLLIVIGAVMMALGTSLIFIVSIRGRYLKAITSGMFRLFVAGAALLGLGLVIYMVGALATNP